jgi:hypothetical protein
MDSVPRIVSVDFLSEDELIVFFTDGKLARLRAEDIYPVAILETDWVFPPDEPEGD